LEAINNSWLTTEKLIIGVLVILLLLQQQCDNLPKGKIIYNLKTDTITTIKTVVKLDTITRYIKLKVPTPKQEYDDGGISGIEDTLSKYTQAFKDSLIDGVFTTLVKGELIKADFKYKPVKQYSVTTINNTIEREKPPVNILFLNLSLATNVKQSDIGVGATFYQKKGYLYTLNYFPITKTVNVGFSYKLK
jgi:hypothetical protein